MGQKASSPKVVVEEKLTIQAEAAETAALAIAFLGGLVLVFGAVLTCINLCLTITNSLIGEDRFNHFLPLCCSGPATVTKVRLQLSQMIALGLEILLIGDIIETLVKSTQSYSFENLSKLAIVAAIRTALSFFLGLETKEILELNEEDEKLRKGKAPTESPK